MRATFPWIAWTNRDAALTNTVNLYLEPEHASKVPSGVAESNAELYGYIREALRLDPPFQGVYREL